MLIFINIFTIIVLNAILIFRCEVGFIILSSQCSIMLTKDSRILFCKLNTCSNTVAHPNLMNYFDCMLLLY